MFPSVLVTIWMFLFCVHSQGDLQRDGARFEGGEALALSLSQEAVPAPALQMFKARLGGALSCLVWRGAHGKGWSFLTIL